MQTTADATPIRIAAVLGTLALLVTTGIAAHAALRLGSELSLPIAVYAALVMAAIGSFKVLGAAFFAFGGDPWTKRCGLALAIVCAALTGSAAAYGAATAEPFATTVAVTPLVDFDRIFGWPAGTAFAVAAAGKALTVEYLGLFLFMALAPVWRRSPHHFV